MTVKLLETGMVQEAARVVHRLLRLAHYMNGRERERTIKIQGNLPRCNLPSTVRLSASCKRDIYIASTHYFVAKESEDLFRNY